MGRTIITIPRRAGGGSSVTVFGFRSRWRKKQPRPEAATDTAEIYLALEGEGYLLMQTKEGDVRALKMERGTIAYVPPNWAHRTVNTGPDPFVFFAVWPAHAGHDYGTIEEAGFLELVVERGGQPVLIPNPRYT